MDIYLSICQVGNFPKVERGAENRLYLGSRPGIDPGTVCGLLGATAQDLEYIGHIRAVYEEHIIEKVRNNG